MQCCWETFTRQWQNEKQSNGLDKLFQPHHGCEMGLPVLQTGALCHGCAGACTGAPQRVVHWRGILNIAKGKEREGGRRHTVQTTAR